MWTAIFTAMVLGIPMTVTDHDAPRFRHKRACYAYVIKMVPKLKDELRSHFPFPVAELEARGRCVQEGRRVEAQ